MTYQSKSTDDYKLEHLFTEKLQGQNGRVFSFSQGRAALYAGLRVLDLPENSKVMLCGYTSVGVANAIIYAGLTPEYIDIAEKSYNLDVKKLPNNPENVSALIIQHSYGIAADMQAIMAYCQKHHIHLIEDCCHTFASSYQGTKLGRFGLFSFFSGQWQKFFTTGLGGFIYSENQEFQSKVAEIHAQSYTPSYFDDVLISSQMRLYNLCQTAQQRQKLTGFGQKYLTRHRERGSSDPFNLRHITPADFLSQLTPTQTSYALTALENIGTNIRHRKRIGQIYQNALPNIGFEAIPNTPERDTVYLRYPLRIQNKHDFLKQAKRYKIEIGDWFSAPLHNHKAPLDVYQYQNGQCPNAEATCNQIINLPTHQLVSSNDADNIIQFLQQYAIPLS